MKRAATSCLAIIVWVALAQNSYASWLSRISGVHINLNKGTVRLTKPEPEVIPEMLKNAPKDISRAILSPHGTALAAAIRHAEGQAIGRARPLPRELVEIMRPHFPAAVLNSARWSYRNDVAVRLDSLVMKVADPRAITLNKVIIFNNTVNVLAFDDPSVLELWAHELTHVKQYRSMGVEGFAFVYSYDWNALETQARQWAEIVLKKIQTSLYSSSSQMNAVEISGFGEGDILDQDLVEYAKRAIAAEDCVTWDDEDSTRKFIRIRIENMCRVPVLVDAFLERSVRTNRTREVRCDNGCLIRPGSVQRLERKAHPQWEAEEMIFVFR